MTDFAKFANDAAAERERQLLAGITPTLSAVQSGGNGGTPNSEEAWQKHINSLTLGTKERKLALDQYGDWLEAQHK